MLFLRKTRCRCLLWQRRQVLQAGLARPLIRSLNQTGITQPKVHASPRALFLCPVMPWNFPFSWIFISAIASAFITITLSLTYPSIRRHHHLFFTLLLISGTLASITLYRSLASEAFSQFSPDGRFKIVVYRLPFSSSTPGSGSDCPAIVRLYDADGNRLATADLPMIQMAEVQWFPDNLEVGHLNFALPD